jgi:uncharacterized protein (DUF433 family)
MKESAYVGVGLYSYPEAARILGVPAPKLRRWAGDYRPRAEGTERLHKPVIVRHLGKGQPMLTFVELMELYFVKLFRAEGVSMPTIRKAAEEAARRFGTSHPFAVQRFDTDGHRIFATLRENAREERVVEELGRGQLVFDTVARSFFRKLDYPDDGAVRRYWPLGHEGRVVLDPQRAFGQPIDAESGVPTRALYEAVLADGGQPPEAVAKWFDVPLAAVHAAVKYETGLLAA